MMSIRFINSIIPILPIMIIIRRSIRSTIYIWAIYIITPNDVYSNLVK